MRRAPLLMTILLLCGLMAAPVMAQDEKAEAEKVDPVIEALRNDNPHIQIIEDKARALVAPLSQPQMQTLYEMREAYGILQSVTIVMRDVGRAVRLCGEDNPELADDMTSRYETWESAVKPVQEEKQDALQTAIDEQDFTKPAQIRDYFGALDDAATYAEKQLDKRVVTTPEACNGLRESMDNTQETLIGLLSELKIPDVTAAEDTKTEDEEKDS